MMNRAIWIDSAVGSVVIGLTTAVGIISAYFAPPGWHSPLYTLCIMIAVLTAAQTARAVRGAIHHERRFTELDKGQDYLAQPESTRQFDLIWQRQVALEAAENLFRENFEIEDEDATKTSAQCNVCGWQSDEKALAYVREDAVQHYREYHEHLASRPWYGLRKKRAPTPT